MLPLMVFCIRVIREIRGKAFDLSSGDFVSGSEGVNKAGNL